MGTRGLVGFCVDGEDKLQYNHFDSYPSGKGVDVLAFCREMVSDDRVQDARDHARLLRAVSEDEKPTAEDYEHFALFHDKGVSEGDDWYALLRDTQGDPGLMLDAGVYLEGRDFAADSLWCEWAYVVDLDAEVLEVYKGFQTEPHAEGRFHDLPSRDSASSTYYPVRLVASFPFDELPEADEFCAITDPPEDEEEEGW